MFAVLHVLAAMFNDCIIKTISSDAESREKYRTNVGRVTGDFASICKEKHGKEAKTKDLALLKKAAFPAIFTDKDHPNRNFMVSNAIVILLLLG